MLIPYVEINGQKTITDEQIRSIWNQLVKDGTEKVVFYESGVKNEEEFLKWVKNPNNLMVFPIREDKLMGVAWINGINGNYAFGHFAFFKESAGKYTIDMGKEILDYWFSIPGDDGPLFEVILGLIPEFNQKALHYIEKLGFERVGRIPRIVNRNGNKEAAILSYYEG